jgi:hypothetical protein
VVSSFFPDTFNHKGHAATQRHTRLAIAFKDSVGCNSCLGGVGPPASLRFRRAQ